MDRETPTDRGGLVSPDSDPVEQARALLRAEAREPARRDVDDFLRRAVALRDRSRPGTFTRGRGQRLVDRALELRARLG